MTISTNITLKNCTCMFLWDGHAYGGCLLINRRRRELHCIKISIFLLRSTCAYLDHPIHLSHVEVRNGTLAASSCNEKSSERLVKTLENHESSSTPWKRQGKSMSKSGSYQLESRRVKAGISNRSSYPILSFVNEQIESQISKVMCSI